MEFDIDNDKIQIEKNGEKKYSDVLFTFDT